MENTDNKEVKNLNGDFFTEENISKAENELPQFPIEIFPDYVIRYIESAHDKNAFFKSYSSTAFICGVSFALGGRTTFHYQSTFPVKGNLWSNTIGDPTSKKSPASNTLIKPLNDINSTLFDEYIDAKKEYDTLDPDSKNSAVEPVPKKVSVTDITIQALGTVLYQNKDGVFSYHDEMSAFLNSLSQYNTNSKPTFLSLWRSEEISIDRKSETPIHISDPYYSLHGNTTFEVWAGYQSKNNISDGFSERFIVTLPDTYKYKRRKSGGVDKSSLNQIIQLYLKIYNERQERHIYPTEEFQERYTDWVNTVEEFAHDNYTNQKKSIVGKLGEYVLRFSLLMNRIEGSEKVEVSHLEKALKLFEYYKATAFFVNDMKNGISPLRFINNPQIVDILLRVKEKGTVTTAEIIKLFEDDGMHRNTAIQYKDKTDLFLKEGHGRYLRKY